MLSKLSRVLVKIAGLIFTVNVPCRSPPPNVTTPLVLVKLRGDTLQGR